MILFSKSKLHPLNPRTCGQKGAHGTLPLDACGGTRKIRGLIKQSDQTLRRLSIQQGDVSFVVAAVGKS